MEDYKAITVDKEVTIGNIILEKGDRISIVEAKTSGGVKDSKMIEILAKIAQQYGSERNLKMYEILKFQETSNKVNGNIITAAIKSFSIRMSWKFRINFSGTTPSASTQIEGNFSLTTSFDKKGNQSLYIVDGTVTDLTKGLKKKSFQSDGKY